jgi:hypothetical protein
MQSKSARSSRTQQALATTRSARLTGLSARPHPSHDHHHTVASRMEFHGRARRRRGRAPGDQQGTRRHAGDILAGLFPALRATSMAPISAVRGGATLPRSWFAPLRPYLAGLITVIGLAGIATGMTSGGGARSVLVSLAAGTLLLFAGVAMTSSHVI